MVQVRVSTSAPEAITIYVLLSIRHRGGRKQIISPAGEQWAPRTSIDSTLIKALARAFRWRKLLETGAYATVAPHIGR